MQRNGIIDRTRDPTLRKALLDNVTARFIAQATSRAAASHLAGNSHGVEVIDVLSTRGHAGKHNTGNVLQKRVVQRRMSMARGGPIRQVPELYAQDCGLQ